MDPLDHTASSHLVCPQERYEKDEYRKVITVRWDMYHIISSSHLVADGEDEKPNHLHHSLSRRNKKEEDKNSLRGCFSCLKNLIVGNPYYFHCNVCPGSYHKECVESPSVFHSSDHPKHSLQLLGFQYSRINLTPCHSCGDTISYSMYYCSICDFMIHPFCAKNPTPFTIDNRKRHEHTLHYFPRRSALVCDVCGTEDNTDFFYVCLLCDFVVHKRCVYLPYVIEVSRHIHRLSFTPTLPYKEQTDCGVCRLQINENYGEYSCIKGCAYAIHSKCAMRSDVSDGKEHEGEPEEAYEDTKMFEVEGDGIIRHLSHPHHQMRLDTKIQTVYGETKHCEACRLPLYVDGNVYQCMQCDFILHESCANIPLLKQFMLHVHPLVLKWDSSWFECRLCLRNSCGFRFVCSNQGCDWELDTLCASIYEPFDHHSHPHPLFITSEQITFKVCSICRLATRQPLDCVKCNFSLCFHCATLPHKTRYEHDEHLVTFSHGKDINNKVCWCEICEEGIDPMSGLYACNKCRITLHIECLLGRDPYLKPGQSSYGIGGKIHARPNTCSTRPRCKACERICPYKIRLEALFYQKKHKRSEVGTVCSFKCYYRLTFYLLK